MTQLGYIVFQALCGESVSLTLKKAKQKQPLWVLYTLTITWSEPINYNSIHSRVVKFMHCKLLYRTMFNWLIKHLI